MVLWSRPVGTSCHNILSVGFTDIITYTVLYDKVPDGILSYRTV